MQEKKIMDIKGTPVDIKKLDNIKTIKILENINNEFEKKQNGCLIGSDWNQWSKWAESI